MAAEEIAYYTAEEFFKAFENSPERMELIDGEIIMQAAPSEAHQDIAGGLYTAIRNFIKGRNGGCKP